MKDFSHGRLDLKLSEQQAELARLALPWRNTWNYFIQCFYLLITGSVCFADLIVIGGLLSLTQVPLTWELCKLSFCSKQQKNCNMTRLSSFAYLILHVLRCEYRHYRHDTIYRAALTHIFNSCYRSRERWSTAWPVTTSSGWKHRLGKREYTLHILTMSHMCGK